MNDIYLQKSNAKCTSELELRKHEPITSDAPWCMFQKQFKRSC